MPSSTLEAFRGDSPAAASPWRDVMLPPFSATFPASRQGEPEELGVFGFEGLIRGPSDSVLHSPLNLFKVAAHSGLLEETEAACCRQLAQAYAASGQFHKLFLNVSPGSLSHPAFQALLLDEPGELGLPPDRVVIELTENQPTQGFELPRETAERYRSRGYALAMDDLGEGFSSLRLWSELRPEFVKIDLHLVQGVSQDPIKLQFLRSLRDIAARTSSPPSNPGGAGSSVRRRQPRAPWTRHRPVLPKFRLNTKTPLISQGCLLVAPRGIEPLLTP
jgi:EAL domain-containing protein (putative c-di-GMP-specific phosphodiesterase class I)